MLPTPVVVPGGGGHSGHALQSPITGGQHICCPPPPQPKPGPLSLLGSLTEVDFISGFRAPRDGSGPRGKHQDSERTWARAGEMIPKVEGTRPWGLSRKRVPKCLKGPKTTYPTIANAEKQFKRSKRGPFSLYIGSPRVPPRKWNQWGPKGKVPPSPSQFLHP